MLVRFSGNFSVPLIPVHPWNALVPIDVMLSGKLRDNNPVQSWKALFPIDVTEFGISIDVNK